MGERKEKRSEPEDRIPGEAGEGTSLQTCQSIDLARENGSRQSTGLRQKPFYCSATSNVFTDQFVFHQKMTSNDTQECCSRVQNPRLKQ